MRRTIIILLLLLSMGISDSIAQRHKKSKSIPKQPFAMIDSLTVDIQPKAIVERHADDPITGKHHGHEWVDLGLPSGVRWATCNYRAARPQQAGEYYGWGDSTPRCEYSRDVSKSHGVDTGDISNNLAYDEVRRVWGRGWRMPTIADFQELIDNCDYMFTQYGDSYGAIFMSRTNGQFIFLPLTGYKENWDFMDASIEGLYWTSTPHSEAFNDAHIFRFNATTSGYGWAQRHLGLCIRPVCDYMREEKYPTSGVAGGHEWKDLGLPSGTRWATCNVDATKPSQPGKHYAWGEQTTKSTYSIATSKYINKSLGDISGKASYDVAAAKWGNGWRMPTVKELYELVVYCNWKYTKVDGRWGVMLTSTFNGESIFLPATGHKWDNDHYEPNGCGNYWTSTQHSDNACAYSYQYGAALGEVSYTGINAGLAIRPVLSKESNIETPATGSTDDHEWVDLGLPSGTKWATCNIGATHPDEFGTHYAWGEIIPATIRSSKKNELEDVSITQSIAGDMRYDVATIAWGDAWTIPTKEQYEELVDNCTWEWTTMCRRNGYKVTSKINGNWIFLPAAGEFSRHTYYEYDIPSEVNKYGAYWTATPSPLEYGDESYNFHFNYLDSGLRINSGYRTYGYSIRPVTK